MKNHFARMVWSMGFFGIVATTMMGMAHADPATIPFSISGPDISAAGTLTGNYTILNGFADTVFVATSASGSYSDTTDGIAGTITGLLAGKTFTSIPSTGTGNLDSINATGVPFPPASYDNLLYPNGDSPVVCNPAFYPYYGGHLDIFGLMFTLNLQGGGNGLVNVWSNGILNDPSNPIGLDYGISDGTLTTPNGPLFTAENYVGNSNNYPMSYSPSGVQFNTVPEPSFLLVLGAGIASLPLLGLRRKRHA